MVRSRSFRLVLVVAVAVSVAPIVATGPATAADARLTVSDTTVAPDTPTAGAPITASATVQLSGGSDTRLALDSVRVVRANGSVLVNDTLGNASELGTISPGESLTVPVTFTVDRPKVYDLEVVAVGTDADGETVRATRPLTVGVERGSPQVELRADGLVAGADRPVEAEISNPTTAQLRGIELRVTDPATGERTRRTVPALAAGASTTVNLSVRAESAGETDLTVATEYTDPTGVTRTTTASRTVSVEPLSVDVGVRATEASAEDQQQVPNGIGSVIGGNGGSALQSQDDSEESTGGSSATQADVTVTNFGNAPIEDVVVTGETADGTALGSVGRFAVADSLEPGESATVTVDLSQVRTAAGLQFVASYDAPDGRAESAVAYDYAAERGNATVTGLDVTVDESGRVNLSGNLANTGDGEITSAVVRIEPTATVSPAYPQRTYFVGTVAASEFAPFELTATADTANATAVTLGVEYTAGGERTVRTVQVPLPDAAESGGDGGAASAQSTGIALTLAVGIVVTLAVILGRRFR